MSHVLKLEGGGLKILNTTYSIFFSKLMPKAPEVPKLSLLTCNLANISQCEPTEAAETFVVTLYNPLSRPVSQVVRLPVIGKAYKVLGPDGNEFNN